MLSQALNLPRHYLTNSLALAPEALNPRRPDPQGAYVLDLVGSVLAWSCWNSKQRHFLTC